VPFAQIQRSLYPVLVALFVAVLLISNISAVKLIQVGPLILDGGAFLFPLAYILGDVLSEVYGLKATRKAIWLGFIASITASLVFWIVQLTPAPDAWENQEAFESVLGFVPRIVLASLVAYVIGQMLNAWVLVKIKARTRENKLWLRLIGSTLVAQLADTIIFCTIAFYGVITGLDFLNYVIVGYVFKVLVEIAVMPITYRVVAAVKRREPTYFEG
jgi:uncharacterized integral membrane protein (TIGR00697 family)